MSETATQQDLEDTRTLVKLLLHRIDRLESRIRKLEKEEEIKLPLEPVA